MTRQFVRCVTVTGADNNTRIDDMLELANKYPYVEWGILLSLNNGGCPRFPDFSWIDFLGETKGANPFMALSGHLCGTWVRQLLVGKGPFSTHVWMSMFDRFQLNFHGQTHYVIPALFRAELARVPQPVIFQADGVNDNLLLEAQRLNTPPLMDKSHGAGIVPDKWPSPTSPYCGYAGGLSPNNVAAQLEEIVKVIGTKTQVWIDAETHLRSMRDGRDILDMDKVERYLLAARPYVNYAEKV